MKWFRYVKEKLLEMLEDFSLDIPHKEIKVPEEIITDDTLHSDILKGCFIINPMNGALIKVPGISSGLPMKANNAEEVIERLEEAYVGLLDMYQTSMILNGGIQTRHTQSILIEASFTKNNCLYLSQGITPEGMDIGEDE